MRARLPLPLQHGNQTGNQLSLRLDYTFKLHYLFAQLGLVVGEFAVREISSGICMV